MLLCHFNVKILYGPPKKQTNKLLCPNLKRVDKFSPLTIT